MHSFHPLLGEQADLPLHETDEERVRAKLAHYIRGSANSSCRVPTFEERDGGYYCTTSHLSDADIVAIPGPVFYGSPIEPDNWGMWLLNGLASASTFIHQNDTNKYLCWARFDWQRQLLRFLGLRDDDVIVQDPWRLYQCEAVILHQFSKIDLIPTASDRSVLNEVRGRCGRASASSPEKIFVSRPRLGANAYRVLVNESELASAFEDVGFTVVEPETLPFDKQVRTFAAAKVVIGLGGAGMFNAIFCSPGTKVVSIESSSRFIQGHANLFASSGLEYGFVLGKEDMADMRPVHKRWSVDVTGCMNAVSAFLADSEFPSRSSSAAGAFMAPPVAQNGGGRAAISLTDVAVVDAKDGTRARDEAVTKIPALRGEEYIVVLDRLHRILLPKTYLEIGTQAGRSLAVARCPSIAIDPEFRISTNVFYDRETCHLFQMRSDDFFQEYDPTIFVRGKIDLAFLDGAHLFEFVLRDFLNTERYCAPDSIIILHDCIPLDAFMARRDPSSTAGREGSSHPEWWCGDVWKLIPTLRRYRPGLKILAFDAPPTGLVLVTALDPSSRVMQDNYSKAVEEAGMMSLCETGLGNYVESLNVQETNSLQTRGQLEEQLGV
jgi:hypothetical protein